MAKKKEEEFFSDPEEAFNVGFGTGVAASILAFVVILIAGNHVDNLETAEEWCESQGEGYVLEDYSSRFFSGEVFEVICSKTVDHKVVESKFSFPEGLEATLE